MITQHQIERLSDNGAFDLLVTAVLRNGRELPLAARLRMTDPDGVAPAALGLALLRSCELTHAPTRGMCDMAERLVARAGTEGGWGTIAATAAAVAGLEALLAHSERAGGSMTQEFAGSVRRVIDGGIHWLAARQGVPSQRVFFEESEEPYAPERSLIGDALDSALVVWLLGSSARFGAAARVRDLAEACADESRRDPQTRRVLAMSGVEETPDIAGRRAARRMALVA